MPEICAIVSCVGDARALAAAGVQRVYLDVIDLEPTDEALGEVWAQGLVPLLDEVCREGDRARLDPWVAAGGPVAVGNISELALAAERGAAPEIRSCIPVHNQSCVEALEEAGAAGFWLSGELTLEQVCELARSSSVPVGLMVLGRERAMTSEHCVLQVTGKCVHDCRKCPQRARRFSLKDIDGKLLPVRTDVNGRSRIWSAYPLDATPQAGELIEAGVTRLLADCTLLDAKQTRFSVERVARAVACARAGRKPAARMQGATSGHLFTAIG